MFKSYRDAFFSDRKNSSDKWEHYFEIYDYVFGHLYGAEITYLEIGVQNGGSLEVARKLFSPNSKIIGLDMDPNCSRLKSEMLADDVFIGDQIDDSVIKKISIKYPKIDLIIDDGSHVQAHMLLSFLKLFPLINENGIYLIEDTHTNYHPAYQASYLGIGLYDYFKAVSERLNIQWMNYSYGETRFTQPRELRGPMIPRAYPENIFSIEFFDSVIAVRKRAKLEPLRIRK